MKKIVKKIALKIKSVLSPKQISALPTKTGTEFEVNNWVISDFIVKKIIPIVDVHPFPLGELSLMTSAVCYIRPTHIFEWGTNIGKSARIFYEIVTYFNISSEIHSIDLPETVDHNEHPHKKRGILVKGKKGVALHEGDGVTTALHILSQYKGVPNPLFFLDGDHSFESVARELESIAGAYPKAHILIHDTFYQSDTSNYNIGPYKAVTDFLDRNSTLYTVLYTNTGLPGMTLLLAK